MSEISSRSGRFAMQDRSQGDIFFSSPQQKLIKFCVKFQWSGILYEFLCPCFELGHFHINVLALLALKLAILTDLTIHVQVDNIALASTTLSLKDGWYPQSIAFKIQQANWELSIIPLDHHYSKLQSTFQAS